MPIYEYRCESCGHELEKLQRMSDPELTDCPDCGKAALNRLVSAAGFRLKGSGWYETDFKKDGKKNLHDSASAETKAAKTDTPDKPDSSKPAKTKETTTAKSKPAKSSKDSG